MIYGKEREVEILGKKMVFVGFSYLLHSFEDHEEHNQRSENCGQKYWEYKT